MPRKKKVVEEITGTSETPNVEQQATTAGAPSDATPGFKPYTPNPDAAKSTPKPRLSFNLTTDGLLDTEGTRAETLQRVKDFFNDPRNAELLGRQVKIEEIISKEDVGMIFDALGQVECFMFTALAKIDADIATNHTRWTDKQKEMVTPPTQRLAAKYAGSIGAYLRWKDEITLAVIILTIGRAQMAGAKMEQAARNQAKLEQLGIAGNPPGPAPLPNMGLDVVSSEIVKN